MFAYFVTLCVVYVAAHAGYEVGMMTLIVVLAAVALVVGAGEAVRGQCRRMIARPLPLGPRRQVVTATDVAQSETAASQALAA